METLVLRPKNAYANAAQGYVQTIPLSLSYYDAKLRNTYSILEDYTVFLGQLAQGKTYQKNEAEINFSSGLYELTYDPNDDKAVNTILANAILNHPFVYDVNKSRDEQNHNFVRAHFYVEIKSKTVAKNFSAAEGASKALFAFWALPKSEWLDVAFAMRHNVNTTEPLRLAAELGDNVTGLVVKNPELFFAYLANKEQNPIALNVNKAKMLGVFGDNTENGVFTFNNAPIGRNVDDAVIYFAKSEALYKMLLDDITAKDINFRDYNAALALVEQPNFIAQPKATGVDATALLEEVSKKDQELFDVKTKADEQAAEIERLKALLSNVDEAKTGNAANVGSEANAATATSAPATIAPAPKPATRTVVTKNN
jgi:hypothetical protein